MAPALKRLIPWRVRTLAQRLQYAAEDRWLGLWTRPLPLPRSVAHKRVLLLGASVGQAWRLQLVFTHLSALAAYQFDKTPLVERALAARPDGVIIKECAAYFPRSQLGLDAVQAWVERLQGAGIATALATVVPVTREHAARVPGRAEGLWAFNDGLRELCAARGIPLLDLEQALRSSSSERYLAPGLDSGDGLHLARTTYRTRLDPLIPPLLLRLFPPRGAGG